MFPKPRIRLCPILEAEVLQRGRQVRRNRCAIPRDPMLPRDVVDGRGDGGSEPVEVPEGGNRDPKIDLRLGLWQPGARAPGYAKGGSADLLADSSTVADFHALSYAGQMVVEATPVTFCFAVNWMSADPHRTSDALTLAFGDVIKGCLVAIKQQLLA